MKMAMMNDGRFMDSSVIDMEKFEFII